MKNNTLKYFKELSKIPRCSKNEKNVIEYLKKWSEDKWFEYKTDKIGNILITVPATLWCEDKETIVLQAHVDMVCVKSKDSKHNFETDEIEIIEKDWWIYWNNTTLWADNGIWVAMAMACTHLDKHPKLELLFTVDEEQWMSWAILLEEWFITWTKLINLDSEDEWEITIWSAGWSRIEIKGKFDYNKSDLNAYSFKITWLKWGHSWVEIHKSSWNAIDAFFQLLDELDVNFELWYIEAWIAENVIPKELEAKVCIGDIYDIWDKIKEFEVNYRKKYNEPDFKIEFNILDYFIETIDNKISEKIKDWIILARSWVYNKSKELKDFVLTSQNLWICRINNWNVELQYLCRSSIEEELEFLISQKRVAFSDFLSVNAKDPNPGWAEDINSDLIKLVKNSYEKILNKEVELLWVHAWLECWAIINKMPSWSNAVSIWPNIYWAHTIEERCEIRSIWVLSDVMKEILSNI